MQVYDRVRNLRSKADNATRSFQESVKNVGTLQYADQVDSYYIHENVKIREADEVPYSIELDQDKYQIVVILSGEWRIVYNNVIRLLSVADVVKVPSGRKFKTIMETDDLKAKFVYVQFKWGDD